MKKKLIATLMTLALLVAVIGEPNVALAKTYQSESGEACVFKGTLKKRRFQNHREEWYTGYELVLKKKIKVVSEFYGKSKEKRLQLFTLDGSEAALKRNAGKKVKIRGKLMTGMTGYYYHKYFIHDAELV